MFLVWDESVIGKGSSVLMWHGSVIGKDHSV